MPSDLDAVRTSVRDLAYSSPILTIGTTLSDLGGRVSDTLRDWRGRLASSSKPDRKPDRTRDIALPARRSMRGGKR